MSWYDTVEREAGNLEGSRLEYAWKSFSTRPEFCVALSSNRHLTAAMRAALLNHPNGKVREAFAKRTDLTEAETTTILEGKSSGVAAAWLATHPVDSATIEALHARGRAGILDMLIRNSKRLDLKSASKEVLADCLARALTTNVTSEGVWGMADNFSEADHAHLRQAYDTCKDLAATNFDLTYTLGRNLANREDSLEPDVLSLGLMMAEKGGRSTKGVLLSILERQLSNQAVKPGRLPAGLAARLQKLVSDPNTEYPRLALMADAGLGVRTFDAWGILKNERASDEAAVQALAALVGAGHRWDELKSKGIQPAPDVVAQAAGLVPYLEARQLLEDYLTDKDRPYMRKGQYSAFLVFSEREDEPEQSLELARLVAKTMPDTFAEGWDYLTVPEAFVPVIPLRHQMSHYSWQRNSAVVAALLDMAIRLEQSGRSQAEIDMMIDNLMKTFTGTIEDLEATLEFNIAVEETSPSRTVRTRTGRGPAHTI